MSLWVLPAILIGLLSFVDSLGLPAAGLSCRVSYEAGRGGLQRTAGGGL